MSLSYLTIAKLSSVYFVVKFLPSPRLRVVLSFSEHKKFSRKEPVCVRRTGRRQVSPKKQKNGFLPIYPQMTQMSADGMFSCISWLNFFALNRATLRTLREIPCISWLNFFALRALRGFVRYPFCLPRSPRLRVVSLLFPLRLRVVRYKIFL